MPEYYIVSLGPSHAEYNDKKINMAMGDEQTATNRYTDYVEGKIRSNSIEYYVHVYLTKFVVNEDGIILAEFHVAQTYLKNHQWYRDVISNLN